MIKKNGQGGVKPAIFLLLLGAMLFPVTGFVAPLLNLFGAAEAEKDVSSQDFVADEGCAPHNVEPDDRDVKLSPEDSARVHTHQVPTATIWDDLQPKKLPNFSRHAYTRKVKPVSLERDLADINDSFQVILRSAANISKMEHSYVEELLNVALRWFKQAKGIWNENIVSHGQPSDVEIASFLKIYEDMTAVCNMWHVKLPPSYHGALPEFVRSVRDDVAGKVDDYLKNLSPHLNRLRNLLRSLNTILQEVELSRSNNRNRQDTSFWTMPSDQQVSKQAKKILKQAKALKAQTAQTLEHRIGSALSYVDRIIMLGNSCAAEYQIELYHLAVQANHITQTLLEEYSQTSKADFDWYQEFTLLYRSYQNSCIMMVLGHLEDQQLSLTEDQRQAIENNLEENERLMTLFSGRGPQRMMLQWRLDRLQESNALIRQGVVGSVPWFKAIAWMITSAVGVGGLYVGGKASAQYYRDYQKRQAVAKRELQLAQSIFCRGMIDTTGGLPVVSVDVKDLETCQLPNSRFVVLHVTDDVEADYELDEDEREVVAILDRQTGEICEVQGYLAATDDDRYCIGGEHFKSTLLVDDHEPNREVQACINKIDKTLLPALDQEDLLKELSDGLTSYLLHGVTCQTIHPNVLRMTFPVDVINPLVFSVFLEHLDQKLNRVQSKTIVTIEPNVKGGCIEFHFARKITPKIEQAISGYCGSAQKETAKTMGEFRTGKSLKQTLGTKLKGFLSRYYHLEMDKVPAVNMVGHEIIFTLNQESYQKLKELTGCVSTYVRLEKAAQGEGGQLILNVVEADDFDPAAVKHSTFRSVDHYFRSIRPKVETQEEETEGEEEEEEETHVEVNQAEEVDEQTISRLARYRLGLRGKLGKQVKLVKACDIRMLHFAKQGLKVALNWKEGTSSSKRETLTEDGRTRIKNYLSGYGLRDEDILTGSGDTIYSFYIEEDFLMSGPEEDGQFAKSKRRAYYLQRRLTDILSGLYQDRRFKKPNTLLDMRSLIRQEGNIVTVDLTKLNQHFEKKLQLQPNQLFSIKKLRVPLSNLMYVMLENLDRPEYQLDGNNPNVFKINLAAFHDLESVAAFCDVVSQHVSTDLEYVLSRCRLPRKRAGVHKKKKQKHFMGNSTFFGGNSDEPPPNGPSNQSHSSDSGSKISTQFQK